MVCQFGRGWHTNFGVLCTPNFLECELKFLFQQMEIPVFMFDVL